MNNEYFTILSSKTVFIHSLGIVFLLRDLDSLHKLRPTMVQKMHWALGSAALPLQWVGERPDRPMHGYAKRAWHGPWGLDDSI